MRSHPLDDLQSRVDAATDLDGDLLHRAAEELRTVYPAAPSHPELSSDPTEAVLRLVDHCLPGWSITLRGTATEPNGHWHCALRESGTRDNDDVIGSSDAPTVGLALLRALVSVARLQI